MGVKIEVLLVRLRNLILPGKIIYIVRTRPSTTFSIDIPDERSSSRTRLMPGWLGYCTWEGYGSYKISINYYVVVACTEYSRRSVVHLYCSTLRCCRSNGWGIWRSLQVRFHGFDILDFIFHDFGNGFQLFRKRKRNSLGNRRGGERIRYSWNWACYSLSCTAHGWGVFWTIDH